MDGALIFEKIAIFFTKKKTWTKPNPSSYHCKKLISPNDLNPITIWVGHKIITAWTARQALDVRRWVTKCLVLGIVSLKVI